MHPPARAPDDRGDARICERDADRHRRFTLGLRTDHEARRGQRAEVELAASHRSRASPPRRTAAQVSSPGIAARACSIAITPSRTTAPARPAHPRRSTFPATRRLGAPTCTNQPGHEPLHPRPGRKRECRRQRPLRRARAGRASGAAPPRCRTARHASPTDQQQQQDHHHDRDHLLHHQCPDCERGFRLHLRERHERRDPAPFRAVRTRAQPIA